MANILGQMVLGLGLFFIGMHMVGENLRQLSSRGFRTLVARLTASSLRGGLLGTVFGALMQSATAVTFILVNMVGSGLIGGRQALPIIAWSNVGLTALAFVAGLSIHTEVLYLVGLSGLALAFLRRPSTQLVSGVAVGVGLLLFGLETISAGARPLHDLDWFQRLLRETVHEPLIGFFAGFLLALLVQSNTAATLIVIALARAGALDLAQASMIIYGTNLGTIIIRLILAAGLHGSALQLVRFEDGFCLVSGALMMALFYVERWGHVPLVGALASAVSSELALQLAVVFLLSNLLPALLLGPFFGVVESGLARLWPPGKEEEDAAPRFLPPLADADPATSLDLVLREEARLLRHAGHHLDGFRKRPAAPIMTGEDFGRAFSRLAQSIAEFNDGLAQSLTALSSVERLKLTQEVLSLIGDLEEAAGELAQTWPRLTATFSEGVRPVVESLAETWDLAVRAADELHEENITRLREVTRRQGPLFEQVRKHCAAAAAAGATATLADALDLSGTVERLLWMLHHLAKLLAEISAHHPNRPPQ